MEKVKVSIRPLIQWDEAYRAALATQGIDSQGKFPSIDWRIRSLMLSCANTHPFIGWMIAGYHP